METKRQAAWSWTGTARARGSSSTDSTEESEEAGDRVRLSSDLGEDGGEVEEDEEGQDGGSAGGFLAAGAGFLMVRFALLAVAWVSLRWTMSNSSLKPGHCRRDLAHWLQVGRVSSHYSGGPELTSMSQT